MHTQNTVHLYVYQQLHYHFTFWSIIRIINLLFHSPRVNRYHIQAQHSSPLLKQRVSCSTVGAAPSNLISSNQGRPLYQHLVCKGGVLKLGITVFICFTKYPPPSPNFYLKKICMAQESNPSVCYEARPVKTLSDSQITRSLFTIAVSQDYSID